MYKSTLPLAVLVLSAFQQPAAFEERPSLLKEERMTLEFTATADEVVLIVEAESEEALDAVEIQSPDGVPILRLRSEGGRRLALQGFVLETRERSFDAFSRSYAEGRYDIHARTVDGRRALGGAVLSHALVRPPVVTHPLAGARDVPADDLVVTWVPDGDAVAYQVAIEQGETDGLSAKLPKGTGSFRIPAGVLEPGTETQLEIAAIGANGNKTLVEIPFTTR